MGSTLSSCIKNRRPTPPQPEHQECHTTCLLHDLPLEILIYYIFPHLSGCDIGRLSCVSKYFNKLLMSDDVGNLVWSEKIEQQGFDTNHWRFQGMKFINEKSKFRYLYLYKKYKERENEENRRTWAHSKELERRNQEERNRQREKNLDRQRRRKLYHRYCKERQRNECGCNCSGQCSCHHI